LLIRGISPMCYIFSLPICVVHVQTLLTLWRTRGIWLIDGILDWESSYFEVHIYRYVTELDSSYTLDLLLHCTCHIIISTYPSAIALSFYRRLDWNALTLRRYWLRIGFLQMSVRAILYWWNISNLPNVMMASLLFFRYW